MANASSEEKEQQYQDRLEKAYNENPARYHLCGGGFFGTWVVAEACIYNPIRNISTRIGDYYQCDGRLRSKDKGKCMAEHIILDDPRGNGAVRSLTSQQKNFIIANPRKEFFKHEVITLRIDNNLNPKPDEDFKQFQARIKAYIEDIAKS